MKLIKERTLIFVPRLPGVNCFKWDIIDGYKRRSWLWENIEKKRVSWCKERKHWTAVDHWKNWKLSDEYQVEIGNNNLVYFWRKSDKVDNRHLVCALKKRKLSVMLWGCIYIDRVGTLTSVKGNIKSIQEL